MMKPTHIFKAALSGRYYASRAYKVINPEKGLFVVTGQKEDVTEQVRAIVNTELTRLQEQLRVAKEALVTAKRAIWSMEESSDYKIRASDEIHQIINAALEQIKGK